MDQEAVPSLDAEVSILTSRTAPAKRVQMPCRAGMESHQKKCMVGHVLQHGAAA